MIPFPPKTISSLITQKKEELQSLISYPDKELAAIIKDVGFRCDFCAMCCTVQFNDHVFLLDSDTARIKQIEPDAMVPAPYYEFCDNNGSFYVSGYSLKTRPDGSCIFLEEGRCRIYSDRLTICRVYPYMLHREADSDGNMDWRQISGLNEHGCYHNEINDGECTHIASETKDYETAFLKQEIVFLEAVGAHFKANGLRHFQRNYDKQMRSFEKGGEIDVMVYYNGCFECNRISKGNYLSPDA